MTTLNFAVKLLNESTASARMLGQAIALYSRYTPAHLKTASNEIAYWANRYNNSCDNRLMLYGLQYSGRLVGFCQLVAFQAERIIVIDQLVVHPHQRSITTFSAFVELIRSDIEQRGIDYNFAIVEVPIEQGGHEPFENERLMIRLLKLHGFGVVKQSYEMPNLDPANYEAAGRAHLLIFAKGGAKKIVSDTYIAIVKTIFYKHYYFWYNIPEHQDGLRLYRKSLDCLFEKLSNNALKSKVIELNGYSPMTSDNVATQHDELSWLLKFTFPAIAVLLLVMASIALLKLSLNIDVGDTLLLLSVSMVSVLVFQAARTVAMQEILSIAIKLLKSLNRSG